MIIDKTAAIKESWIVAEKPLTKNLMLFQPPFVVGSITYQPQAPGLDAQLDNSNIKTIAMMVFFCTTLPMLML